MNETKIKSLEEILSHYPRNSSQLIPVLQETQSHFGYLPANAMETIGKYLHVPAATVFGVATFYAQFKFAPIGKKVVKVCRGTACHVRGASKILEQVQKRLKIKPGETSGDLEYSLEAIACFGSCALAPVMVVDDTVYGRMTPAKVDEILNIKE